MRLKIAIVGIGGVGGYFGGRLAAHYTGSESVQIYFIARGAHLAAIKKNGLKLIHGDNKWIAHPALATDRPAEIGLMDVIIFCTKTYDLENSVQQMKPCIGADTILLPVLNGVNSTERIKYLLPNAKTWEGLVYIIARLTNPGEVRNMGNIQKMFFGWDKKPTDKMILLEKVIKEAGIDVTLSGKMSKVIWEKYIFISSIATLTSFLDHTIGEIMADVEQKKLLIELIDEVQSIADKKGVAVDPDVKKNALARFESLPFEATSSMHSDFKNKKKKTELNSLTGYVVQQGEQLKVQVPTYQRMFEELAKGDR
ncbi:MAG: 2-dehydropantoate 2-reductase [Bacteroidota bacterium]